MVQGRLWGVLIVLSIGLAGCLDTPSSPIGSVPQLLIDYIVEADDIQIVVKGIEDHFYSNISIRINGVETRENYTYLLSLRTSEEKLILSSEVWDGEQAYVYAANFTLVIEEQEVYFLVETALSSEPLREDLPYRTILEKAE